MLKLFLLICVPIALFIMLEYQNISLYIAVKSWDMQYYLGKDDYIKDYNSAILLAQANKYQEAKSLLKPMLNSKDLPNPADIYEIYWDLVHASNGSTGDTIVFYNRSLEYYDNLRVRTKIDYLMNNIPIQAPQQSTWTLSQDDTSISGSVARESRRKELELSWSQMSQVRDLSAGMIQPQDIISRTLDMLSTSSTIPKDW